MLDAHKQKAQQVHSQYQAERTKVINDKHLSDAGKRDQLTKLKANCDREIGINIDEAVMANEGVRL